MYGHKLSEAPDSAPGSFTGHSFVSKYNSKSFTKVSYSFPTPLTFKGTGIVNLCFLVKNIEDVLSGVQV